MENGNLRSSSLAIASSIKAVRSGGSSMSLYDPASSVEREEKFRSYSGICRSTTRTKWWLV